MTDHETNTSSIWLDPRLATPDADTATGASIQLAGSWCEGCRRAEFPQRSACPVCLGETSRIALSHAGVVVGHTAVLHQPPGSLLPAPYGIVAVQHDEGITVLGPLVGSCWDRVALGIVARTVVIEVGDHKGFGYQLG